MFYLHLGRLMQPHWLTKDGDIGQMVKFKMHPALELFTIFECGVELEGTYLTKIRHGIKEYLCLFLMLTSTIVGLSSFLPMVGAQTVTTAISTIVPQSGTVGSGVLLVANITTSNGRFNVTFDGVVEATGNAVGNLVNTTFFVPQTQLGVHNVTIVDLTTTNENASTTFTVSTAYSINVTSVPIQESDSVQIYVNMTGGNSTQGNTVTLSVETPTNNTYSGNVNISASDAGTGIASLIYPDNFTTPTGSNTNFVGSYSISSNTTATPQSFTVDLTNSTEYHRYDTINIKAAGYAHNGENVTLTVSGSSFQTVVNLTADSNGIINYSNLTVPANASVGSYNVNIVSPLGPTIKVPADSQTFIVPGFAINVTAENLAGEPVPSAGISAFENGASVDNETADSNGLAVMTLEIGNYTLQGYDEGQQVGQIGLNVTGNETTNFVLNLTDLNIKVVALINGAEIGIPEASIYLTPEDVSLTTDINGDAVASSLLPVPGAAYVLNVSRYGVPFNFTYAPIPSLQVANISVAFFNVTIVSPSFTLLVTAFKADGQPFSNASVEANELVGGITYNATTGSDGIADFQNVTFGTYTVEIIGSTGNIINTTTVELFQDENATIVCNLYDLTVNVTVTDYFGQPFANTNVTLQGKDSSPISLKTQADGTAIFDNLTGDSFTISVYLSNQGSPTAAQSVIVEGSTAVSMRLGRYVLLAGLPVEASQFAATIVIILSLLAVILFEVFRRRGRSRKSDS